MWRGEDEKHGGETNEGRAGDKKMVGVEVAFMEGKSVQELTEPEGGGMTTSAAFRSPSPVEPFQPPTRMKTLSPALSAVETELWSPQLSSLQLTELRAAQVPSNISMAVS